MDPKSKIFTCLRSNPEAPESTFLELLQTLNKEEIFALKSLKSSLPFPTLNTALEKFLQTLNIPLESPLVSHFIPSENIKSLINESRFPIQAEKDMFDKIMKEIFLYSGKIPHHERLMGHFPLYLEKHFEVVKIVFVSDLSIPYNWRYYIAYMAAATHKCGYLMRLEQFYCELFLGSWFEEVPEKLQKLGTANVKLAHRPWEFTEKDVKELLREWNLNELVLALTVLCQFHCLSGLTFGLGINEECDFARPANKEEVVVQTKAKTNVALILREYSETAEIEDYISDSSEDLHGEDEDILYSRIAGGYLTYINYPMDSISRSFNASDFKFSDQGYYILEKLIPEVSESIWNRIRLAYAMTYDTINQTSGIETAPLRRAIWNYVQRVYGLQYDDYNYTEINKFLKINTKKYIKKVACFPETVLEADYLNIELDLSHDDMIHLNLIICEARFEAQLVYMLYAVQKAIESGVTSI